MHKESDEAIPDRYRYAVIAHIMVDGAAAAIDFYCEALGAKELFRILSPDSKIIHAEIQIEQSVVMVGDAAGPFSAPSTLGGTTTGLHVYVSDVDSLSAQALRAGAVELQPPQDMFYGARQSMLKDPFGHVWILLTAQERLTPEEILQRGKAQFGGK